MFNRNQLIRFISKYHKCAIFCYKRSEASGDYNSQALWKGRASAINGCLNKALHSKTQEVERLYYLALRIYVASSHQLGDMLKKI